MGDKTKIIFAGGLVGLLAVILVKLGNPLNMGFCIACFERDIAGALGFHRASALQYIRPEIIGIVLGALVAAVMSREYRAEGGSSPVIRFVLGILVMIGALAFLGCPLRMVLRLAGGDLNALLGMSGFAVGIISGIQFLKNGYNLGRSVEQPVSNGLFLPIIMAVLLVLLIASSGSAQLVQKAVFLSASGPGSMHAPMLLSLIAGIAVGLAAQRTRLCLMGGTRDMFLVNDYYLVSGFLSIFTVALFGNIITGNFSFGFTGQPAAHSQHLWNFLAMAVVGLGSVLLGGCPLRQLVLSGRGNSDSAVSVLGMIAGAAIAHNFGFAASGKGLSSAGRSAVIIALVVALLIGYMHREKQQ